MEELKKEYNYYLQRFYNGCKYCDEHIEEIDIWVPEINKIMDKLGELLNKIGKASTKEIMEGFKI